MNVRDAISKRRAVKHFDADHVMAEDDFKALIETALLSPSSFNLQHWRFVRVRDDEKRTAIRAAAWDQAQVTEASELLVLCADLRAWKNDAAYVWRDAPAEVSELMQSMIGPFYEGKDQLQRDEALRSVGIISQTLMLAAQEIGYDTCPMIGFDADKVAEIINLPEDHIIGMIITLGKRSKEPFEHGGRLSYEKALVENEF